MEFVRERAAVAVRGNHDEALAHSVACRCAPASKPLAEATRTVHRQLLSHDQVTFLGALPLTGSLKAGGGSIFTVHASPQEHRYCYTLMPDAPEEHLGAEIAGVDDDVIVLGHTHFPMLRRVGAKTVINPGSVGQPRDGDPHASYAVIEDGNPFLRRVPYDVERTIRDLRGLSISTEITDRLASILRSGKA